jgi:hypothetical protein
MADLPRWAKAPAPGAEATDRGWVTPKGELLVSHRGLKSKIAALGGVTKPVKKKAKKADEPVVEKDAWEEVAESGEE